MKEYIATKDGAGIYLSKTEQVEKMLAAGCNIVELEDGKDPKLIGTPERGLFGGEPELGRSESSTREEA